MAEEPQIARYCIGEGGACGAPPAAVGAACDAGIAPIDMPLTPRSSRAIAENGLGIAVE